MSCQERATSPLPDDSAYFPLEVGNYWTYQVSTETYLTANVPTKQSYQLQQKVSSSYQMNGQLVFIIDELTRPTNQSPWTLKSIRSLYKNRVEVIDQDNNSPIVKLAFPIAPSTSWNKNLYNTNPLSLLRYEAIVRPFISGKNRFDNTVTVLGTNDSTLVSQEKYLRVYARSIGCVYQEDRSLAFCQESPACLGTGAIQSGTTAKWVLIASDRFP
ncbi:hypothetical protein [Spirosoma sordidisoli]|uniref:Uncharacterized protein n=1 Tax=Spirosoma sordidisoli TaxID=2502893 RepID=A0A4Q2UNS8_9BACT|nr:hypothetical protein [Spirosoma sordidisoli]RYC71323.1 hypothetical protein EQG79_04050 [Spirosoma sordidisoli]